MSPTFFVRIFCKKIWGQNNQTPNKALEFLAPKFCMKNARKKTLMKLTPGLNFSGPKLVFAKFGAV
jgi:hypothetical protein